ncbi:ATP-dependent zinc protease [Salinisphaera orenii]|uniref:Ribosomal protein S6 modification protein n=1 Tax=Salinisphaera orenii YIM 95161 TaxID=1051139 RepID=A0A423QBB7_9GAMM|nr:Ribosomal protein S6 modification protein [Salinisphaera halophila YIM 95161]
MRPPRLRFLVSGLFVLALMPGLLIPASADSDKTIYGWVENARIEPWGVEAKAKLDTGALTSSLHATDIERFKRDGETWVRFTTRIEDQRDEDMAEREFERPLFRRLRVTGAGGSDERPVVLLRICMNDTIYEEQFSLRDRGDMNYPMLLGRRTIEHLGLIDVSETFLNEPSCDDDSEFVAQDEDDDA